MNLDDPLYAREGDAIGGELLKELLRRQAHAGSVRKATAQKSYDIYRNRLTNHVIAAINLQQSSDKVKKELAKFLTNVRNDALDITEQAAVVWKNGAERSFAIDSDNDREAAEEAMHDMAAEADFDEVAAMANHLAWLQGPQFVVPMVRGRKRRRLCADVVGPHVADIVQNEDDPLGMPVAIAWPVGKLINDGYVEHDIYVLDSQSLRRFKYSGGNYVEDQDATVEHGMGELPAACLRFSKPLAGDDWWLVDNQSRLVNGTIDVAVKLSRLSMVRKSQCHNLVELTGPFDEKAGKGQTLAGDPEGSVKLPGKTAANIRFEVHEFDTPPDSFIREVLFWALCMVEPYGGHIQVDSGQPDIFGKIVIPHEAQAEHRRQQVKPCTTFETKFWTAVAHVAREDKHPLASDLPRAGDVAKLFRATFGELTKAIEDPEKAMKRTDWDLSRGQTSEVQIMRKRLGGVSHDEAQKAIERNLKDRGWFNDIAASRTIPTGKGGKAQTAAEAFGAMGTPAREAGKENREETPPESDAAA